MYGWYLLSRRGAEAGVMAKAAPVSTFLGAHLSRLCYVIYVSFLITINFCFGHSIQCPTRAHVSFLLFVCEVLRCEAASRGLSREELYGVMASQ